MIERLAATRSGANWRRNGQVALSFGSRLNVWLIYAYWAGVQLRHLTPALSPGSRGERRGGPLTPALSPGYRGEGEYQVRRTGTLCWARNCLTWATV